MKPSAIGCSSVLNDISKSNHGRHFIPVVIRFCCYHHFRTYHSPASSSYWIIHATTSITQHLCNWIPSEDVIERTMAATRLGLLLPNLDFKFMILSNPGESITFKISTLQTEDLNLWMINRLCFPDFHKSLIRAPNVQTLLFRRTRGNYDAKMKPYTGILRHFSCNTSNGSRRR